MLSATIKSLLSALLMSALAMASLAGSIELTPVRIDLSAAAKVAVLIVRNTGDEDSVMQVSLNSWTLDGDSHYAYEPSQELIVTPVTFRLAPGKQQIVRIGLRAGPPVERELAFRLLVEEVPPPLTSEVSVTRLVVRHDLPVFVAPSALAKASLDVSVECAADGARLRVVNNGNAHAKLLGVVLDDAAGKELAHWDTFDYLLPAAQKGWSLATLAPKAAGKSLQVTLVTEQGAVTAHVESSCR